MTMDSAMIEQVYATMRAKQADARRLMGRPLTDREDFVCSRGRNARYTAGAS